jgi:uncharacterized protein YjbI with pentapeptide repeats
MRTHTDRDLRMLVARSRRVPLQLAGAHLEMANLPYVDLSGANLAGANLRGAMLEGALLDGACLDGADLTCANLGWADLSKCSVNDTLLVEANLEEAAVGSNYETAVTVGADMVTITFSAEALRSFAARTPLNVPEEVARLNEAQRAREEQAIWDTHVQNAPQLLRARRCWPSWPQEREQAYARVLSDSDIRDLLHWSASTGTPLNLRGCNLSGANLRNASLRGANLAHTDATAADTRGVDRVDANLQNSCGWETPQKKSPASPWWKLW